MKNDSQLNNIKISDENKELNKKKFFKKDKSNNNIYLSRKNNIKDLTFNSSEFHSSYSNNFTKNKNKKKINKKENNFQSSPNFSSESEKISSVIDNIMNTENEISSKSNSLKNNYENISSNKSKSSSKNKNSKSSQNEETHYLNVIRKFHNVYTKLTGRTFIVQSDFCLKTEQEFFEKKKNLEIIILLITILSLINAIVYYEITFSNAEEKYNNYNITLLYNLHLLNILFFIAIFLKEKIGGLGIGDLGPIPNPQSPIPNPHLNK